MNKLTAEKCRNRIERLKELEKSPWFLSEEGEYQLQALEIALTVLEQQDAFISCVAHLDAAISLLERGGKKAAGSGKMFNIMIGDYKRALSDARAVINGVTK